MSIMVQFTFDALRQRQFHAQGCPSTLPSLQRDWRRAKHEHESGFMLVQCLDMSRVMLGRCGVLGLAPTFTLFRRRPFTLVFCVLSFEGLDVSACSIIVYYYAVVPLISLLDGNLWSGRWMRFQPVAT